jgi:superoxide dismutase, Cu-Zn family
MKRIALILLLGACGARTDQPAPGARADLYNAAGDRVATATLFQQDDGVRVRVSAGSLTSGEHGFHVHEVGQCEPPFTSAGGHFNPAGRKHGFHNPQGPHAGDLVNLPANWTNGNVVEMVSAGLTLESLFDANGSALVIHAGPDDYRTDPSGNSGDRIACGVIRRP